MDATRLTTEERAGLVIAVALHIALFVGLAIQFASKPLPPPPPVERVTVSIAPDVGLTSTAPQPVAESRASVAPTLSDAPAPPLAAAPAQVEPAPRVVEPVPVIPRETTPPPVARPTSRPTAKPTQRPTQRPVAKPTAQPSAKPTAKPSAAPATRPSARPSAKPSAAPAAKPAARPAAKPAPATTARPSANSGGSRVGSDFLPGAGSSATSTETRTPASAIGASARASLLSQITREVKPRFDPPSGVEVEKLVSVVRFRLNEKAALVGKPSLVRQTGITDANRPQAARHAELAIRAVELAAPFDLPPEYFEAYKSVTLNFDASL